MPNNPENPSKEPYYDEQAAKLALFREFQDERDFEIGPEKPQFTHPESYGRLETGPWGGYKGFLFLDQGLAKTGHTVVAVDMSPNNMSLAPRVFDDEAIKSFCEIFGVPNTPKPRKSETTK